MTLRSHLPGRFSFLYRPVLGPTEERKGLPSNFCNFTALWQAKANQINLREKALPLLASAPMQRTLFIRQRKDQDVVSLKAETNGLHVLPAQINHVSSDHVPPDQPVSARDRMERAEVVLKSHMAKERIHPPIAQNVFQDQKILPATNQGASPNRKEEVEVLVIGKTRDPIPEEKIQLTVRDLQSPGMEEVKDRTKGQNVFRNRKAKKEVLETEITKDRILKEKIHRSDQSVFQNLLSATAMSEVVKTSQNASLKASRAMRVTRNLLRKPERRSHLYRQRPKTNAIRLPGMSLSENRTMG